MRALVFAVIACAGCYNPSYKDCEISCASGSCPSGMHCNGVQRCVSDLATTCEGLPDAGGGPDASYCGGFSFPISNVTCPLTMQTGDWMITASQTLIASTNPTVPGNPPFAQTIDNGRKILIVAHNVTIAPNAVLTISPDPSGAELPVIIVASGTAQIDGTIAVIAARSSDAQAIVECGAGIGGNAPQCGSVGGGGGGGGGYGPVAIAAPGGVCFGGQSGAAGTPNGDMSLVPLRGGCMGGAGYGPPSPQMMLGGLGGPGGGALQISATRLVVSASGLINVSGGGGFPGPNFGDGGGGGGSGGALLLEAASGTLAGGATLCANGGGGGSEAENGKNGICGPSPGPAPGGGGIAMGGGGAYLATPATTGMAGNQNEPAGGGGGGVGRIHISSTIVSDGNAIITPPAS